MVGGATLLMAKGKSAELPNGAVTGGRYWTLPLLVVVLEKPGVNRDGPLMLAGGSRRVGYLEIYRV